MTALTNFLIATLVSLFSTFTGQDLKPEISDSKSSFSYEQNDGCKPDDLDNCISFSKIKTEEIRAEKKKIKIKNHDN